jgi:hypothetical protein
MTETEVENAADKVADKAWSLLKNRFTYIGIALAIVIGYLGIDLRISRSKLDAFTNAAENSAKQSADSAESIKAKNDKLTSDLKATDELTDQLRAERNAYRVNLQDFGRVLSSVVSEVRAAAPQLRAKLEPQQRVLSELIGSLDYAYCKFGVQSNADNGWTEHLFDFTDAAPEGQLPKEGTRLTALHDVNVRSDFPRHEESKGLFFRPAVDILHAGDVIVVKQLRSYRLKSETHHWISYVPERKP